MKKMYILAVALVVAFSAGQVFGAQYQAGAPTLNLDVGQCQTRTISLNCTDFGTNPLVGGGLYVRNGNVNIVDVSEDAICYDGVEKSPAVWDPGSFEVPDPAGIDGDYFLATSNLGAGVVPSANVLIADLQFCCVGVGTTTLTVSIDPDPTYDMWVNQNQEIKDNLINPFVITVRCTSPPCACTIDGPATVEASALNPVTATYTASGNALCTNPPAYVYSDNCTLADINPSTGVLTVPPTLADETCIITALDTANTDVNTGQPVVCTKQIRIEGGSVCKTEIALGRFCPVGAVADPPYNRPGRRGIAATCGDIIDFTVCSDNPDFDPECLTWTVDPPTLGTIEKVQGLECCWRLTVGDICEQLDKVVTATVTVSDSCCGSEDSITVDIGKVIIDLGETTAQPNTESSLVDVDMVNLDHSVRALTLDVVGCTGNDNLVCTQCLIDPKRTRQFTCSANEQADGSCRIVLYSTNPAAVITQGRGTIAQIVYSAGPELDDLCGDDACVDLCVKPTTVKVSDQYNEDLCTCLESGEVCFVTCGDIFPQDCIGGVCGAETCCGDGVIDLFDILEGVDIILGLQTATPCQLGNGDVPNGMPPYCGNPPGAPNCESDGDLDIFDVLVMIDKALGKMNCCDYCIYGNIF